jgi:hypothetical protein
MLAEYILGTLLAYAACGLLFGLPFVTVGVARFDPSARGASLAFRLLILPGVMAFWPFLALKWRRIHKRAAEFIPAEHP